MARDFWDLSDVFGVDYDNLPPLVPEGADREACIDEIVEQWSTPSPAGPPPDNFENFEGWVDQHVEGFGFVLEKCDFRDDNTGEPIDLNALLARLEEKLRKDSHPPEQNGEILIVIRDCRIELCNAEHRTISPSFVTYRVQFGSNASFRETRFNANAGFEDSRFGERANFDSAKFGRHALFRGAQFGDDALFIDAQFGDHSDFEYASFGRAGSFSHVQFGGNARFKGAQFGDNVSFLQASFGDDAIFQGTRFDAKADFRGSRFGPNANFRFAGFGRGMCLEDADLSGADLRDVTGLILDNTVIRGARFSPRAKDPWSQLRQTYTGPRMVFTLLLLALFFTPYLLRTAGWVGVHHSQQRLTAAIEGLQERHAEGTQPLREDFRADLAAIEALLPSADSGRWRATRVGWLVLSWDHGWRYWALALILLGYNFIRLGLTLVVAPMRDEEERSGHSPLYQIENWRDFRRQSEREDVDPSPDNCTWKERWWARTTKLPMLSHCLMWFRYLQWGWRSRTEAYGWLIPIHWIAKGLAIIAVAAFFYNAYLWLTYPVYIPVF